MLVQEADGLNSEIITKPNRGEAFGLLPFFYFQIQHFITVGTTDRNYVEVDREETQNPVGF